MRRSISICCRSRHHQYYCKIITGLVFVTLLFHLISSPRYEENVASEDKSLFSSFIMLSGLDNTCSNYSTNSTSSQLEEGGLYPTAKDIEKRFYHLFEGNETSRQARIDKMVLVRKLVLYSVRILNTRIQSNPLCVKWWVNPLTTWFFSSVQINAEIREWKLRFRLEPGQLPVEAVIRQNQFVKFPINLAAQQELELVSVNLLPTRFSKTDVTLDCLCKSGKDEAELRSIEARSEWNKTDPELKHWPPNSSFIFTDYVDFLDENYFLINPGKFLHQNTTFCGPTVRIIVLIHSAPNNFERRATIRKTYGSRQNLNPFFAQILFFLGTVNDFRIQELVNQEVEEFDDIVQANFVDSYFNVTLKHLSLLLWIYSRCGTGSQMDTKKMPRYILKADDDVVLNMDTAIRLTDSNPDAGMMFVSCHLIPK